MKRGAPDHPKTKRLARILCDGDIGKAVGHLELLWHFTAKYAPDGGIGVFDDAEIAEGAKWDGIPAEFVPALIEAGWIDEQNGSRLIVHDWPDHADDYVHTVLCRARKVFADGTLPNLGKLSKTERIDARKWLESLKAHKRATKGRTTTSVSPTKGPSPPLPSPPAPCPSKPSPPTSSPSRKTEVEAVVNHWCQYHVRGRPGAKERRKIADRLGDGFGVSDLIEAIDGCHKTPHNLGANDQDQKYLSLELIMRTSDQVARFIENNENPPRPRNDKERRVLEASERWLERMGGDGQI